MLPNGAAVTLRSTETTALRVSVLGRAGGR